MRRRMKKLMKKMAAVCMALALTLAMVLFSAGPVSAVEAASGDTVSAEEDSDHSGTLFAVMAVVAGTAVCAVLRSRRRWWGGRDSEAGPCVRTVKNETDRIEEGDRTW